MRPVLISSGDGFFFASPPSVGLFDLSVDAFGSLLDGAPRDLVVKLSPDGSK